MTIKYSFFLFVLFFITCRRDLKSVKGNGSAYIVVRFDGVEAPDSLSLYYLKNTVNGLKYKNYIPPKIITSGGNHFGSFLFEINDIVRPSYVSLTKNDFVSDMGETENVPRFLLENYIIEPNDSVKIVITRGPDSTRFHQGLSIREYLRTYSSLSFSFSGRGSAKYRCRYQCDSMLMSHHGGLAISPISNDTSNYFNVVYNRGFQILCKYDGIIDDLAFEVLKADFVGILNCSRYGLLYPSLLEIPQDSVALITQKIDFLKLDLMTTSKYISNERAKAISFYYPVSLNLYNTDLLVLNGYGKFNMLGDSVFSILRKNYYGELRDKLLTYSVLSRYFVPTQIKLLFISKALTIVSSPYCRKLLIDYRDAHEPGTLISDLPLKDRDGNSVELTKFIGKVIFIDFWFTGCGACKGYYRRSVSKVEKALADDSNVVFVSISIDRSKEVWQRSIENELYSTDDLPNVVNLYTGGKGSRHPLIDFYKIKGYPTPMLFDKNGRLRSSSSKDLRVDSAELIEKIRSVLSM